VRLELAMVGLSKQIESDIQDGRIIHQACYDVRHVSMSCDHIAYHTYTVPDLFARAWHLTSEDWGHSLFSQVA
jgi:hypothetical protein